MNSNVTEKGPYKRLAERLDALPNGFPSTDDGAELRLLAKLFTPEEAALAAHLRLTLETPKQLAERVGGDAKALRKQLKSLASRGLIAAGRADAGLGYGLMPFVVGFYEMQVGTMDAELAQLFEAYYLQAFGPMLQVQPQVHRVIPVGETVRSEMDIRPYENVTDLVNQAQDWGVMECICRKQQALIGQPCEHPLDVCMVLSERPGAFDHATNITQLSRDEALATLHRAAEAGLVHSVSNNQKGTWYICNCCTCACGILRAMADLGIANVIARSAFVNQVDEALCIGCGACVSRCQFDALTVEDIAQVNDVRCVGCGVCALACPEGALSLVRRPTEDVMSPPPTKEDWQEARANARGLDMEAIR